MWWLHEHRRRLRHHRSRSPWRVLLIIEVRSRCDDSGYYVILEPDMEKKIMTTLTLGHTIALTIVYLDQNGNPMLTAPTPDAAPTWTNSTPATETLKVAADGLSAEADSVAAGTDVITLSVVVAGATFSATLAVEVDPAPQVLTSVGIAAVVSA